MRLAGLLKLFWLLLTNGMKVVEICWLSNGS